MNEPLIGIFYDALTGETIERELTADEIANLPETAPPLPPALPPAITTEPTDDAR